MMRHLRSCITLRMGTLLVLAAAVPLPAWACAGVSGENGHVEVVDESAVILWDAATHQERFIRRASFEATGNDFGFLVPTPSVPILSEANDIMFRYLESLIQPRVVEQKQIRFAPYSFLFPSMQTLSTGAQDTKAAAGSVQVLDTQHVAGYDAVVLAADNAEALRDWLRSHGYTAPPELLDWLTPYIRAHWKITAFKISKNNPRQGYASSSAVSMSFTSSRPFFPYREPSNQRTLGHYAAARSLRVFLLSAARMDGTLGDSAASASWPGKVVFAGPLSNTRRHEFENTFSLRTPQPSSPLWLTTFEDRSAPRPGTADVFFAPAVQQTPVAPPPVTVTRVQKIPLPVEPLVLLGGAGIFFGLKGRRKRSLSLAEGQ